MEIKGKVLAVLDMESGNGKNGEWKRQTIVIEYESGNYMTKLALSNMSNADSFAKIKVGDTGTFMVDPKSKEYKGRWYTEVNCYNWKIDKPNKLQRPAQQPSNTADDLPY